MPQIITYPIDNYETEEKIPSGIGRASRSLHQMVQDSLYELQRGTASNNLSQVAVQVLRLFCDIGLERASHREDDDERTALVILPTLHDVYELQSWSDGWNGYDAYASTHETVQYAEHWISLFYHEVINSGQHWLEPNVTASAEGEVLFEWRRDTKALTLYIGNQSAGYVKDWGLDINTEMEDGQANSPNIRRELWNWLMS